jgi:homoserine trans-succinylase
MYTVGMFEKQGNLRHHLKRRGYNDKVIVLFSKASEINRNDLLEYKEKRSTNGFPLFSLNILL